MSFEFDIEPKDAAAIDYMSRSHKAILKASREAKRTRKLTQKEIARRLDVDKSWVSKVLSGAGNLTERSIGELAWAIGYRATLVLEAIEPDNHRTDFVRIDFSERAGASKAAPATESKRDSFQYTLSKSDNMVSANG